jgi:hypothetical protein
VALRLAKGFRLAFFRWELPRVHALHERLRAFDASWLDMRNEWF